MQSGQKGNGVILRGSIFLAIAVVLIYLAVLVPLSASVLQVSNEAHSGGDHSEGDHSGGDHSGGDQSGGDHCGGDHSHEGKPCVDKCDRPFSTPPSTTTKYKTVKVRLLIPICVPVKYYDQVKKCTGEGKKKVWTTETVCKTKQVCITKEIYIHVKLKRDCTTTTTYQKCTKMVKCGKTSCSEAGTYTKEISHRTRCTHWTFVC